ncbi:MAG: zinc-ribbon domain-containing protein [Deltaproteobacteria bacterium]|nr:zinc-ribbon domain-containing protein [Deltaproteobacteria bacterium]
MDVRCEKCLTLYELETARVPPEGVAVKCGNCNHVFRAYPVPETINKSALRLRYPNGEITPVDDMATLQRWIVERRVSRNDELAIGNDNWQHLRDIDDLAPFFALVGDTEPLSTSDTTNKLPPLTLKPPPISTNSASITNWKNNTQPLPQFLTAGIKLNSKSVENSDSQYVVSDIRSNWQNQEEYVYNLRAQPKNHLNLIILLAVLLITLLIGTILLLRPEIKKRVFGHKVNSLILQQLHNANVELHRDSYAAIEHARSIYETILIAEPKYALAKASLAQAELNRADYLAEEINEIEVALTTTFADDREVAAKQHEAIVERKKEFQQRVNNAFNQAKGAIELDPDGAAGLLAIADYYRIMKAFNRMRPLLKQARQIAPQDPWLAYIEGTSVADDPTLTERAIRHFDEALEAAPDLMRVRYRLARIFQTQGNSSKALFHVETILKTVPDHERARALLNELNPPPPPPLKPTLSNLSTDYELDSATYLQHFTLAERLRRSEKTELAIKHYNLALAQKPNDAAAYTGIGFCNLDTDNYQNALQSFKKALAAKPDFADAHFGIAEVYRMQDKKADAIKHYRKYLEITPEGDDASLAKRMLSKLTQ